MEAGEALLEPGFQPGDGQGQLAADGSQGLAAQQAEDGLGLACGVPAAGWGWRGAGRVSRLVCGVGLAIGFMMFGLPDPVSKKIGGNILQQSGMRWTEVGAANILAPA